MDRVGPALLAWERKARGARQRGAVEVRYGGGTMVGGGRAEELRKSLGRAVCVPA